MGKGSEWIAASENDGPGSCKAHNVGISPQEDRGGAAGTVGEGEGWEEEGGIERGGCPHWQPTEPLIAAFLVLCRRHMRLFDEINCRS
jgi:hypothetical protein